MKYSGIYKIRNLLNGKVYIGQSTDITFRFKRHKNNFKNSKKHPLYNAMMHYGIDNFEFGVIEHIEDETKLDEHEQYWLDYYTSYNPEFGYNILQEAKTTRGYKYSDESRAKMSYAKKGKVTWNKGMKMSDEIRKKLSDSAKAQNRTISKEHQLKMQEGKKGKPNWNKGKSSGMKGKKHSKEAKEKMSINRKGVSAWNKGIKYTEEQKKKYVGFKKGHPYYGKKSNT